MTEVTRLSLAVDSTDVAKADAALSKMAQAGNAAATSATKVEAASKGAANAMGAAATQAQKAGQAQQAISAGASSAAAAIGKAGEATKLSAYQAQQLGFQLNDLFVQVASGQSPITALVQQGSQLSGTFGGIRGTFAALGTVFTPLRLLLGGTAAAAAGLAYEIYQGSQQSLALERSLILTGNAAGQTQAGFSDLTRTVADNTKTTVGGARDTLQALVATGRFGPEALGKVATATQLLSKATGQSTDEIAQNFVALADDVVGESAKMNKQFNFLTAAQLESVKAAAEQGDTQRALVTVLDALIPRLGDAADKVGLLSKAFGVAKGVASDFANYLQSIGRDDSTGEIAARLSRDIERIQKAQANRDPGSFLFRQQQGVLESLTAQREGLDRLTSAERQAAAVRAQTIQQERAQTAINAIIEGQLTTRERLAKTLTNIAVQAQKAGLPQDQLDTLSANARRAADPGLPQADLNARLAAIQRGYSTATQAIQAGEQVLQANRAAGLVADSAYYEARRALIQADASAQTDALRKEIGNLAAFADANKAFLADSQLIDIQRQIADRQQKIADITVRSGAQVAQTYTQEGAAAKALGNVFLQLEADAATYTSTLERLRQREIESFSLPAEAKNRLQARQQIEDEYQRKAEALVLRRAKGEFRTRDNPEAAYKQELDLLERTRAEALAIEENYFAKRKALQEDFNTGAKAAILQYQEDAANSSKQVQGVFTDVFTGLEDVVVEFAKSGKLSFKSFADSVIADIARIAARQAIAGALGGGGGFDFGGFLTSTIGSFFGGSYTGFNPGNIDTGTRGGRADGGAVSPGGKYPVNERGMPELLTSNGRQYLIPTAAGTVTPGAPAMQSRVINAPVYVTVAGNTDRRTAMQVGAEAARAINRAAARNA